MQNKLLRYVVSFAVLLSLFVVMLGAYTRLTDAGLGCPDWPGCYGQMVLPNAKEKLQAAQTQYPEIPIESRKAWTEMAHRYAAGSLALLIFFIGFYVVRKRLQGSNLPWHLPVALLILVFFQAALGMWTVTLKLLPVVVMGHLLGGMLIVACLSRFRLQISAVKGQDLSQWRSWLRLGMLIVFMQIALGGWVSSNYAGISCIGFPMCNGVWLPDLHFAQGFNLFSPVGANYQGGLLDHDVRVTIQFIHRLGAIITAVYILVLALLILLRSRFNYLKTAALVLCLLILVQFTLGILNVIYLLPISVAVAHNGVAALLLATLFSTLHFTRKGQNDAR
ncbi:COX15/CtaA family protein [Fluoribacter gormanii]|uniref:Cytochrome c oxidase assembly protein subunit 15 n=1 Tax=Fluoribacter gormanii TaxID=464 RepID=A0A377GMN3_9GAMM|nr:COX15/CtaA family protein [Fluoribacter gormanii]KTD05678.1 cytochrome c oxidase assembly protein [Fluoribacter gormanii]MCW8442538.1 COX15/CtaA family protein [Fluoribacter gormanii]SIQ64281.1 cytochrome c oxidase assembly protein subunit 15 [Fluoribacter gormanii]STO25853.1 Heme A synthase [Fluoribacter gormanii]